MSSLLCFAHRGASGHAPENTLLAVGKALALNAPWIEIDVQAVAGTLVVLHDDTLQRTTNGFGRVADQSLAYLRSLDAGEGERIPLLSEVFDLVDRRAGINVELKSPATEVPVAGLVDSYVNRFGWRYEQFLISSFDHGRLARVKECQPRLPVGPLIKGSPPRDLGFARELDAYSLNVGLRFVNRRCVEDAHEQGLKLFVFTVNEARQIDRMRELGVDGVFTDYPELVTEE